MCLDSAYCSLICLNGIDRFCQGSLKDELKSWWFLFKKHFIFGTKTLGVNKKPRSSLDERGFYRG
jgi:hypothetical protein